MTDRAWRVLLGIGLAIVLGPAEAEMRGPDPQLELKQKYRCPIADRLQRVYDAGDPAQDRHRFLGVALPAPRRGYVQCIFHDNETMIYCEADSGFYDARPGTPRTAYIAADRIAALARLGFSTDDRHSNFTLDRRIATPPDFGALADLMLDALFSGYDARAHDTLEFNAPFAPGVVIGCDPTG